MTTIDVGSRTVELSNQDKVLFPEAGITKGELVDYYRRVADCMLPHITGLPLVLRRFPDGIGRNGFYQKQISDHFPGWIDTTTLGKQEGGTVTHVVAGDPATLVYLANQGTVELHMLLAPAHRPRHPDQLILDLDPPSDDPALVVAGARVVRRLLDDIGVTGFVKSTGSRGVHVHVHLDGRGDFDAARGVARALAEAVVARDPERFTVAQYKKDRGDRLFVDSLRNSYGQHAVVPYGVRALPGAPVAVPLEWDEATSSGFDPRRFTIANLFRRLAQRSDPWAEAGRHVYSLARLRAQLE